MKKIVTVMLLLGLSAGWARATEGEEEESKTPIAPEGAPAGTPATLGFRISAMVLQPENPRIGIAYRETGANYLLALGESTPEGLRLESVEYDKGQAVFIKDGLKYVAKLEEDAELRLATLPQAVPAAPEETQTSDRALPEEGPEGQPVVLQGQDGRRIEVAALGDEHMALREGATTYALPRAIAERILSMEQLSQEEKAQMLLTFPLLVDIQPGEDPGKKIEERQKAIMGTPPTEPPKSMPPAIEPPAPPM